MKEELMALVAELIIMRKHMRRNWGNADQLKQLRTLLNDIDGQLPVHASPGSAVARIYALMEEALDTIPDLPDNEVCTTHIQNELRRLAGEMLNIFMPEPSMLQA